jgi:hypothetical protein
MLARLPSPQGRILIPSRQGNRDGERIWTNVLPGAMRCRPRSRATPDRASRATAVTSMQSGGTEPPMRIRSRINVLRANRQPRASARAAGRNLGGTNPPRRRTSRRASALPAVSPLPAVLAKRKTPFSTSDISALRWGHRRCPVLPIDRHARMARSHVVASPHCEFSLESKQAMLTASARICLDNPAACASNFAPSSATQRETTGCQL